MKDLSPLLAPRSVAIVGASDHETALRGRLTRTILLHPYAGRVHLVSRSRGEILGRPTSPSLAAIGEPVDLAVLLVPAAAVAEALEEAGRCGVRAAIVVASGFAEEQGGEGAAMQREIAAVAERHGILMNGPNSEGIVNTALGLAPTFSPVLEAPFPDEVWGEAMFAPIAIIAQSGALGFGLYDIARHKGLPVSHVVTTGNEASLGVCDYLEHLLEHGPAGAFALYLEDIRDGRRFMALARRALEEGRAIVVAKAGASQAGRRSAVSHTGAMAGSDAAYDAVFRRFGIARAGSMEELVDIAACFARFRSLPPAGRRVGIASSSGGAAGWLADACTGLGLQVPELDAASRARIDPLLPSYGSSANPVDATAQAIHAVGYAGFVEMLAESPSVDMVGMVATLRTTTILGREADHLAAVSRRLAKPAVIWSYTLPAPASVEIAARAGVPLVSEMRHAARALAALADWREARAALERAVPPVPVPAVTLPRRCGVLDEAEARDVLAAAGIPAGEVERVTSACEAVAAVRRFGRPVALKVLSPDLPHRTEAGGVALGLADEAAVAEAHDRVLAAVRSHAPKARLRGVLVQPMAPPGVETIVGTTTDPTFGPMALVGLGGLFAETLGDVALAPAPVGEAEARAMIGRLKGAALLGGARGRPPLDVDALARLLARVSALAAAHAGRIAEIDLNPVIVHEHGLTLADALVVLAGDRTA